MQTAIIVVQVLIYYAVFLRMDDGLNPSRSFSQYLCVFSICYYVPWYSFPLQFNSVYFKNVQYISSLLCQQICFWGSWMMKHSSCFTKWYEEYQFKQNKIVSVKKESKIWKWVSESWDCNFSGHVILFHTIFSFWMNLTVELMN